jgi:uncharacterized membrane protein YeaQ/YmgE (transglycosylase-associated protein family)
MSVVWFLIIGIVAGWLAGYVTKGRGFGLVGDLVVGVVGALVGGLISQSLGILPVGLLGHLIMATIGAVVFIAILRMVRRV